MRKEEMKKSFPKKTQSFHYAVKASLARLPEEEETMSRKSLLKRGILLSFAAVLAIGATVYAASGVITQITASSRSEAEYQTLPTDQQCMEDIGFAPSLVDGFANGYQFDEASLVKNDQKDETGQSVDKFKSISARYQKDESEVLLSAAKPGVPLEHEGTPVENYKGIDFYYSAHMNKFVPADYTLTEEDKAAQERGDIVFSYGSDTVEVMEIESVSFDIDGIQYNLMEMGGPLGEEELLAMVKEVVDN